MQVTSRESEKRRWISGADIRLPGQEAGGHVQATRGLYEALPKVLEEAKQKPVLAPADRQWEWHPQGAVGRRSGAMLGTRLCCDYRDNGHSAYKQAMLALTQRDCLTICFQDGWPATHRALRNRTFVLWDAAGCPPLARGRVKAKLSRLD